MRDFVTVKWCTSLLPLDTFCIKFSFVQSLPDNGSEYMELFSAANNTRAQVCMVSWKSNPGLPLRRP
ncbi:hypothetical protein ACFX13_016677 [Malus domestica]